MPPPSNTRLLLPGAHVSKELVFVRLTRTALRTGGPIRKSARRPQQKRRPLAGHPRAGTTTENGSGCCLALPLAQRNRRAPALFRRQRRSGRSTVRSPAGRSELHSSCCPRNRHESAALALEHRRARGRSGRAANVGASEHSSSGAPAHAFRRGMPASIGVAQLPARSSRASFGCRLTPLRSALSRGGDKAGSGT